MTDTNPLGDALALIISFTRPVGDGGQVHLQTTVPQNVAASDMNKLVDSLHAAGRRLSTWAALEKARNDLEHVDLSEHGSMIEAQQISAKNEGVPRMKTEDVNKLQQAQQNIVAAGEIRKKVRHKIASLLSELGQE